MSRRASRRCVHPYGAYTERGPMSQVESSQSCRGLLSIEHVVKETKSEEIQTKAVTSIVRPEKWNVRPCTTSNLANRYVCWRPPSLKEKCGFFRSIGQRRSRQECESTWRRGRACVCGMFVLHWLSAPVTEFSPSPSVCLYTRPFFSLYHFQPRYSPFPSSKTLFSHFIPVSLTPSFFCLKHGSHHSSFPQLAAQWFTLELILSVSGTALLFCLLFKKTQTGVLSHSHPPPFSPLHPSDIHILSLTSVVAVWCWSCSCTSLERLNWEETKRRSVNLFQPIKKPTKLGLKTEDNLSLFPQHVTAGLSAPYMISLVFVVRVNSQEWIIFTEHTVSLLSCFRSSMFVLVSVGCAVLWWSGPLGPVGAADSNQSLMLRHTVKVWKRKRKEDLSSQSVCKNISPNESICSCTGATLVSKPTSGSNRSHHHPHQHLPLPFSSTVPKAASYRLDLIVCGVGCVHCVLACVEKHMFVNMYGRYTSVLPANMSLRAALYMCARSTAPHVLSNWQELRHMELINSRLLAH